MRGAQYFRLFDRVTLCTESHHQHVMPRRTRVEVGLVLAEQVRRSYRQGIGELAKRL